LKIKKGQSKIINQKSKIKKRSIENQKSKIKNV